MNIKLFFHFCHFLIIFATNPTPRLHFYPLRLRRLHLCRGRFFNLLPPQGYPW